MATHTASTQLSPHSQDWTYDPSSFWTTFRHGTAVLAGLRLHYVEGGQGRPMLLIPGWPQSWYAWRHVMAKVAAAGRRVIAVDPRGMGDSDKPRNGYDLATVAADLHALSSQLGLFEHGPLDVAGHDIGTWIGYAWAADHPQDIRRLALYDAALPGISAPPAGGTPTTEANIKTWHFGFNRLDDLPEILVSGHERAYLQWLFQAKARIAHAITPADLDEYERVFSSPGAARAAFAYYREMFSVSGLEANRKRATHHLDIPVLAFGADGGVGDRLLETLRPIATAVSGGTIADCGHYVPEEAPTTVATQLSAFFG